MKATVYRKGKGLVVEEMQTPKPGPDQVLIRISNAGFCGSDHSIIKYDYVPDGHILGHEVSGTVVEMGKSVTGAAQGDRVTVRPTFCGKCRECLSGRTPLCKVYRRSIGTGDMQGGFAEYMVAYPDMLIPIPAGADSINAAMAEVFATSLHAIRASKVSGGAALVMGCGPIGLALVHIAKNLGFNTVVASEPVEEKRGIALLLGASASIDPLKEDLIARSKEFTGGGGFDAVYECSGVASNIQQGVNCAAPGGVVSIVSVIVGDAAIKPMTFNLNREIKLMGSWSSSQEENSQCLNWMAQGRLDGRSIISDFTTLDDLPGIYHERIDTGKAIKVILRIGPEF